MKLYKLYKFKLTYIKYISSLLLFIILLLNINHNYSVKLKIEKDPFAVLGIDDINPKQILEELDKIDRKKHKNINYSSIKLKTIDDLPDFLQKNNLNENEGIEILSKFLIHDDITLKKYGVVYDISGFDGIPSDESRSSKGNENRLIQRARSSANVYVSRIIK